MGDPGVVVITLTGSDDHDRLEALIADAVDARILEIHVETSLSPETLQRVSELASENDMSLRFRDRS